MGRIRLRAMRRKRYRAPSHVLDRRSLPIGTVLVRRCGDERDGLLPARYVLADVPYVTRRPCPQAGNWPRAGVRWGGVSRIVKDASRERTRRTLFGHGDSCSPQVRPHGAQKCCGQASFVTSISHYGLLHRTSGRQALMLSRWWAADARVERRGARPNRAVVVKTALTCASPTVVRFWNLVESFSTILW